MTAVCPGDAERPRCSDRKLVPANSRTKCHRCVTSCVYRKQAAMWLLGESQHSQKSKLEEKGMSHIITNMDELTLSPTHNTASTAYRRPMFGTQSSDSLTEVTHFHTVHTQTHSCQLSVISWCVCFNLQSEAVDGRSGLTQGDKLRALKSRRSPRPATTGALRYQIRHHPQY